MRDWTRPLLVAGVVFLGAAAFAACVAHPAAAQPAVATTSAHATDQLVAVLLLEDAAARSGPFALEVAYAMRAAADDPELLEPLDRLMSVAETGVPGRAELLSLFRTAADAVEAESWRARESLIDRATLAMREAALRVGIGELPLDDPSAVTARARVALQFGRLDDALRVVDTLRTPAREPMAGWIQAVRARLDVDAAVREYRRRVLTRALP